MNYEELDISELKKINYYVKLELNKKLIRNSDYNRNKLLYFMKVHFNLFYCVNIQCDGSTVYDFIIDLRDIDKNFLFRIKRSYDKVSINYFYGPDTKITGEYKLRNNVLVARKYAQFDSSNLARNNWRVFSEIQFIMNNRSEIYKQYYKYYDLIYRYYYLHKLTFLLCNRNKKIFPKEIGLIISKKIK
jgi:hypothetical protein